MVFLSAYDRKGMTPIHIAADKGHVEIIFELDGLHANLNVQNDDGEIALYLAACKGNTDSVVMLLAGGADKSTYILMLLFLLLFLIGCTDKMKTEPTFN